MFIKVFTTANTFIMVNADHIVYINPGTPSTGCSLILDSGIRLNSIEDYEALLEQMTDTNGSKASAETKNIKKPKKYKK